MYKLILSLAVLLLAFKTYAQADTTHKNEPDTIVVGKFVIIKKNKNNVSKDSDENRNEHAWSMNIGPHRKHYRSNVSTNWFIFDLGFANYNDRTDYNSADAINYLHPNGGAAFTNDDLKLKTIKSSNVNIWLFMQKLNITQHILNLKYGFGLEMYNFRYENNITYHASPAYIFRDTINFSKDKLYVGYLTVPFMINVNTTPHNNKGLSFSAGVSAGYLIGNHNKQVSAEKGKQKIRGDFDLEKWQLAYIAEIGLGPVRLYGSYSMSTLHEKGLKQYPYAVGIRFSNW
ncbi:MAG: outer membrane beta-barrel protein [Chitinophagaceae bacterium]